MTEPSFRDLFGDESTDRFEARMALETKTHRVGDPEIVTDMPPCNEPPTPWGCLAVILLLLVAWLVGS